jgi:very-short-patch-repair endonuclease
VVDQRKRIKPERTENPRALRSGMTLAEHKLWQAIRGKQVAGYRFCRQHPVGPYIADFACLETKLVVELDGGQHQEQVDYDMQRTAFLLREGWRTY